MRAHEIIDDYNDYIDFNKITPELYAEIRVVFDRRESNTISPEMMQSMYGHDIELERLERAKLRAEVDELEASAAAQGRTAAHLSRSTPIRKKRSK